MMIAPPAMGVFSVDMARGVLKLEYRGPEEYARGEQQWDLRSR